MRILMLAPEPFFQPRGTPISVYFRLQALSHLGHEVTLLTYHLGEAVSFPGLRIKRIPNLLGVKQVKIGPSLTKIPLDGLLLCLAKKELLSRHYDLIFTHEEAAFFGVILSRLWRIPHLYDMHSSLPQQLENFRFSRSRWLLAFFQFMEKLVLRYSSAVIVICRDLENKLQREGYEDKAVLIENYLDFSSGMPKPEEVQKLRSTYAPAGQKILLYTGNFEPYQGIPLLLEAAKMLPEGIIFLLVGGTAAEKKAWETRIKAMGLDRRVYLVARVPPEKVSSFIAAADALVSPRLSGTNTPLKIYSYLRSAKPIVATNLWTHTQVLRPEWSVLVSPEPKALAQGINLALFDPEAKKMALKAKEYADREYTQAKYYQKIDEALKLATKKKPNLSLSL